LTGRRAGTTIATLSDYAFSGSSTATVGVGRYVLEVGALVGTRADFAAQPTRNDPRPLNAALRRPGRAAADEVERAVTDAGTVTTRVERAIDLFNTVASGRGFDPQAVSKEADALLGLLERLDRDGRHRDALRLARALSALLALLLRWVALARSLQVALRSAEALADDDALAWAHHELGTFWLAAEDAHAATDHLTRALGIREQIGDVDGVRVTRHNLDLLAPAPPPPPPRRSTWPIVVAVVLILLLLAGGGIAAWLLTRGSSNSSSSTSTTLPTTSSTTTTSSSTTTPAFQLAVFATGPGRVSSNPGNIVCPSLCTANYISGTDVTLTAAPENATVEWGGACQGTTGDQCVVALNANTSVSVNFVPATTSSSSSSGTIG
jgi:hypothetical protein